MAREDTATGVKVASDLLIASGRCFRLRLSLADLASLLAGSSGTGTAAGPSGLVILGSQPVRQTLYLFRHFSIKFCAMHSKIDIARLRCKYFERKS
jgi:hypothetical protein